MIQNAFPTLEKYIQSRHTVDGKFIKVSSAVKREIVDDFEYMLSLKASGLNLFFTDIDYIKDLMLEEMEWFYFSWWKRYYLKEILNQLYKFKLK